VLHISIWRVEAFFGGWLNGDGTEFWPLWQFNFGPLWQRAP